MPSLEDRSSFQFFGLFPTGTRGILGRIDETVSLLQSSLTSHSSQETSNPSLRFPCPSLLRPRAVRRKFPVVEKQEQVLPRTRDETFGNSKPVAEFVTICNPLKLKILLLGRFSGWTTESLARSKVCVLSYKGYVKAEVYRLSGAEDHTLLLEIKARKNPVTLTLPHSFCGTICVRTTSEQKKKRFHLQRLTYSAALRKRMKSGHIHFGHLVDMDEDQVLIETSGKVTLLLMDENDRLRKAKWSRGGTKWLYGNKLQVA